MPHARLAVLAALLPALARAGAPLPLAADTPSATVLGNPFLAPAGWTLRVEGAATILEPPEPGSALALVDVRAATAEEALASAWKAFRPAATWPVKVITPSPDRDGWTDQRTVVYLTSPNERRDVVALVRRAGGVWTVVLVDMDQAVGEKRGAQISLVLGRLLPKGQVRESFAGRPAHRLDAARLAALGRFVERGLAALKVPGTAVGLVQDGKVVFAGGHGVRALGQAAKVDADTLFMVASNTKALTTLLLARLVDEGKISWDTPVVTLLPSFRLGDAETTRQVLVKHLICACTGLPRQDLEWILEYRDATPASVLATLGTMQPTSKFGEVFQYSNPLAAAAGYVAGHVAYPDRELGAAYDEAMRTRVFEPLGMRATTFDFARVARSPDHAAPHAPDVDGRPALADGDLETSIVPVRPAGGAWSSVRDMLRYVSMELAGGSLPGGGRLVSKEVLLARRAPQVAMGTDAWYGMGLMVDRTYGVTVVHHGGDMPGFHSDMIWLPEHGVGAVVLTNGDPGWILRSLFQRKLLEVLFDGKPEADARLDAQAKAFHEELAADRRLLAVPPDPAEVAKLAPRYRNAALGTLEVRPAGGGAVFDFGEWRSPVASRRNPDGTVSFVTTAPGISGLELVVGSGPEPTLVVRDAQHEYVFAAAP